MGQAQLGVTFGGVGESKVNEHVSGVTSYRSSPFALLLAIVLLLIP